VVHPAGAIHEHIDAADACGIPTHRLAIGDIERTGGDDAAIQSIELGWIEIGGINPGSLARKGLSDSLGRCPARPPLPSPSCR
jgi:hypothetical protein